MASPVVYFLRHGETDWNAARRLQGRQDRLLNEQGRAQAVRCAEILHELFGRDSRDADHLDYVSSPLSRARETMDLLRQALGCAAGRYAVEPRLAEMSFGRWEGLTFDEIRQTDGHLLESHRLDRWRFQPPGGESYVQLAVRVGAWHAELRRDTVITAHGGTGRALLAHLGVVSCDAATRHAIEHGVVYVISAHGVTRHD